MRYYKKNNAIFLKMQLYLTTVSVGIIFLLHVFAIIYTPYLNHDVAAYLTAGQMFIGGALPYVDIIDTNFPMIIYINAIPAAFSYLTHVPLAVAGIVFFFCIIIITMLIFVKILKLTFPELTRQEIQCIYIIWLFCSLSTYCQGNFGQREQLIFLFIAPFLVLRNAQYIQVKIPLFLSITITLLAFCGVAIKPFYIFPILLVEAIQVLVHRCFLKAFISIETLIFVCLGILYMTHFYFFPGMSSFYDYWLGFMFRSYSAYGSGVNQVIMALLNQPSIYAYCMLAFFLCLLFFKNKNSLLLLASCFGLFACCSLVIYIWQAKGWAYHLLPFYYSTYIGITLSFFAFRKLFVKGSPIFYSLLLSVVLIFLMIVCYPRPFTLMSKALHVSPFSFPKNKLVKIIESLTAPNDRVLFLSPSTGPGFPALTYTGRKLGGRFLTTFPIAYIFKHSLDYTPEKPWRDDEVMFYEMLEKDVNILKPKLIFITMRDNLQGTAAYFKITEYLRKKGFYKNISSSYRNVGLVKCFLYESFEVWLSNEKKL